MNATSLLRFVHVIGFVLWLGVTLTLALVTGKAVRTGDRGVIAFAYRVSSRILKTWGLAGMVLTLVGGFGLMFSIGYPLFQPFPNHWLFQMQVLGSLSFLVSAFYLVPISDRLADAAEASATAGEESATFRKYRRRVAVVSSIVGALLLVIIFLGTLRP